MTTWVLLLFLGFTPPVQIEGYQTFDQCDRAGQMARLQRHLLVPDASLSHMCVMGPYDIEMDPRAND